MHNYLQNRKQRTKNGTAYSLWEESFSGVSQGSILRPLLFNIFLWDLFLNIAGNCFTYYVDDTIPYVIGNNAEEVVSKLKAITQKLFTWFAQNEMKANLNKCHLLFSITDAFNFEISETVIRNSNSKKLLGVTFDNKLKHISLPFVREPIETWMLWQSWPIIWNWEKTYAYECIFQFSVKLLSCYLDAS